MNKDTQKKVDIGGQAVLEGVMMKAPEHIAIAVRRPNGDIVVKREKYQSPTKKHKWMGLPFIRGGVNMAMMLKLGMKVLEDSSTMLGDSEEPDKLEKWLEKKFGEKAEKIMMGLAMVLAIFLSVGLFVLLPNLPAKALRQAGWSLTGVNLVSGFIRMVILLIYLWIVGLQKDMRRTFQYHGSEHKTVYCHENNLPLTPQNAQKFSCLHPRCGTSFLLLTFILSIVFYSVLDQVVLSVTGFDLGQNYFLRIASRLLLLPLVAGIGYETLKALAHAETPLTRALRWPGMQLQRLTTRKPTDEMCEVAIVAMNAALHGLPEGEETPEGWIILAKEAA